MRSKLVLHHCYSHGIVEFTFLPLSESMLGKKTPKTNSSFGSFSLRMYFSFDLRRPSQPLPMAGFCDLHAKKKIRFDALSIQRTPTIAADATNADADAKAELNTFSFIVHFWILLPKYCKVACLLLPHFLIYVSWKSHMTTFLALSLTHTHSPMTHLVLIWDGNCEKTREREQKNIWHSHDMSTLFYEQSKLFNRKLGF